MEEGGVAFWSQQGGCEVYEGRRKVVGYWLDERAQRGDDWLEDFLHFERWIRSQRSEDCGGEVKRTKKVGGDTKVTDDRLTARQNVMVCA